MRRTKITFLVVAALTMPMAANAGKAGREWTAVAGAPTVRVGVLQGVGRGVFSRPTASDQRNLRTLAQELRQQGKTVKLFPDLHGGLLLAVKGAEKESMSIPHIVDGSGRESPINEMAQSITLPKKGFGATHRVNVVGTTKFTSGNQAIHYDFVDVKRMASTSHILYVPPKLFVKAIHLPDKAAASLTAGGR